MVMHARKPTRIGDGYFEKHQAHPYQNSKYSSSKGSYDRDRVRERDSPNGNSYRSESPECESPRDRSTPYHNKTIYLSKAREKERESRDYKARDKYSECVRSPKDRRNRESRDPEHRTNHDRNSSEKIALRGLKVLAQNSSRETSQRKLSNSSCQDKREERERVVRVGDWSEHLSSTGKKYYYNCKTEVSQWEKPREWLDSRPVLQSVRHDFYVPSNRAGNSNVTLADKHSSNPRVVGSGSGGNVAVGIGGGGGSSKSGSVLNVGSSGSGPCPSTRDKTSISGSGIVTPNQNNSGGLANVVNPSVGCVPSGSCTTTTSTGYCWTPTASVPHELTAPLLDPRKQSESASNSGSVDAQPTDMEICSGDSTPTSETSYSTGGGGPGLGNNITVVTSGGLTSTPSQEVLPANTPGPPSGTCLIPPSTPVHIDTSTCPGHPDTGPPTPTHSETQDCQDARKLVSPPSSLSSLQSLGVGSSLAAIRPQAPNLTPSLANHYRDDLVNHVRGWPADVLEKQAQKLGEEAHALGSLCTRVSAELKCARSVVRRNEIYATRQEQRVLFLRQQIKNLEELKSQNSFMADEA